MIIGFDWFCINNNINRSTENCQKVSHADFTAKQLVPEAIK